MRTFAGHTESQTGETKQPIITDVGPANMHIYAFTFTHLFVSLLHFYSTLPTRASSGQITTTRYNITAPKIH